MNYYIAAALILIAAISKALVDTIVFHQGGRYKGKNFFNINIQGKFLPFTKYPFDGLHVANSLMIFCFVTAGVLAANQTWWISIIAVVVIGSLFNVVFNIFWNKIFKTKK
jgi:hypothetical protein